MKRQHVLIIAEAGVNHNGKLATAKELIDVAADAGADLVKFQTFKAESVVSKEASKAEYQKNYMGGVEDSQYKMLKTLELSEDDHHELISYADLRGIQFFSTAFDIEGLEFLNTLGFNQFKIPSGEITNFSYLSKVASFHKPVILSTGMSDMTEIKAALKVLEQGVEKNDITVLHCNTEYPTPMEDVNLHAMLTIGQECGVKVGYSDHTLGIEVPVAAVALGATVIEKHFTLDRKLPGPDHRASLEPSELRAMVTAIRNVEMAISGHGLKKPSSSEAKNKEFVRKSIHTARALKKGKILMPDDIIALRPGNGISPMLLMTVLGKEVVHDLPAFTKLHLSDVK